MRGTCEAYSLVSFFRSVNGAVRCGRAETKVRRKNATQSRTDQCIRITNSSALIEIYIVIRICPVILSFVCIKSLEMCAFDENVMRSGSMNESERKRGN